MDKIKRSKKTIEVDRKISTLSKELNVIRRCYVAGGSSHLVYDVVPDELKITTDVEKGRRVLTAYYPDTHDIYLIRFYQAGEPSYPFGGVRVYNKSIDEYKILYPDAVVKHKNVEFFNKNLD